MKVTFQGKEWDSKKTYYAAGEERQWIWHPFESIDELKGRSSCSCRKCRLVRIFIDPATGEIESLLFKPVEEKRYCMIRLGWVPKEFVDTTEKKVLANVKKMSPKTIDSKNKKGEESCQRQPVKRTRKKTSTP